MSIRKRVLIVDDEQYILAGLAAKLPWERLGMELAGTAMNGQDALAILQRSPVDIVITDVLMPEVDGLELIASATHLDRTPRFIILSGHSEFEFARRAMSFGVRHYVLKPTRISEIERALVELSVEIDELESDTAVAPGDYPLDLVRDGIVGAILRGLPLDDPDRARALEQMEIDAETTRAVIVAVDLGDTVTPALSRAAQIVAERALTGCRVLGSIASGSCSALLVLPESTGVVPGLATLPGALRRLGTTRRAILYSPGVSLTEAGSCCARLIRSVGGNFYTPAEDVRLFDGGEERPFRGESPEVEAAIGAFRADLRSGDETAAAARLDEVLREAGRERMEPRLAIARIVASLSDVGRAVGGPEPAELREKVGQLDAARDVDQVRTIAGSAVSAVAAVAMRLRQSPQAFTVNMVKDSVRRRYAEHGLTLKRIATSDVYANVDYLGRVFRAVTGQGFSDYLREARMSEAVELLRAFPELPVHEVARRVGFGESSQYFSSTFRRHFGVSPSELRGSTDRPPARSS